MAVSVVRAYRAATPVVTRVGDRAAALGRFTADVAEPYGRAVRADVLAVDHPTYTDLALAALDAVAGDAPVDLIVLAHLMPEVDPRLAVANHLSDRCAGAPLVFAVSEQGTAAPFTALALVAEYLRAGAARHPVLIVLEQAAVPYEVPPGTALPDSDSVVALLFGTGAGPARGQFRGSARVAEPPRRDGARGQFRGSARVAEPPRRDDTGRVVGVTTRGGVAAADVAAGVAAALADLPPAPGRTVTLTPAPGMLATGLWWALADALVEPDDDTGTARRLVLVDHDEVGGLLSVAAVDLSTVDLPTVDLPVRSGA